MKKIILLTSLVVLGGFGGANLIFAQPVKEKAVQPVVQEATVTGVLATIIVGDSSQGTRSQIVVSSQSGELIGFLVPQTAKILDSKGMTITLDKLAMGQKVTIKYPNIAQGIKEVSAVTVEATE